MLSIDIRNNLHYWDYSEREDFEQVYFRNKIFKKGQLKLLDITEKTFQTKLWKSSSKAPKESTQVAEVFKKF